MLNSNQIREFHENGFLFIHDMFSSEEINLLQDEMQAVLAEESPRKILEKNGSVRSFFAPHFTNKIFDDVGKMERLVTPAMQLLDSTVYIHQTKINSKHALLGDWWEWHQDFPFWHFEDGMPTPKVLTCMIFLNGATEYNGPMLLIPGSNKIGLIDTDPNNDNLDGESESFKNYQKSASYMSDLTSKLKYTLKKETLLRWLEQREIFSAKGKEGSVLLFDGLVFHASSNNLSPYDRHTYLITYNSVHNKLGYKENPRPQFLANRDFNPIKATPDNVLLQHLEQREATNLKPSDFSVATES